MGRNTANNAPPEAALIPEIILPEDTPVSLARIEGAELPQLYKIARQALAQLEVSGIPETKLLGDCLDVIASLAKQAKDRTLLNQVLRYRACCERQLGAQIRELKEAGRLAKGTEGQLAGRDSSGGYRALPPEAACLTLEEIGISKRQSARSQAIASLPAEDFEAAVESESPPSISRLAEMARPSKPAVTPRATPDPFRDDIAIILEAADRLRQRAERADPDHATAWGAMVSSVIGKLQATRHVLAEASGSAVVHDIREGRRHG